MKRVLVVEDDDDIRDTLRMLLEFEGYTVITAANGKTALEILKAIEAPCLILLDLMMPVMSGWEFIEAKKKDNQLAKVPVLVISAVADRRRLEGVEGAIKKPIEIEILLRSMEDLCDSERSNESA